MMKLIKYIYIVTIATVLFSCEDYLDKSLDTEGLTQVDVFSDIILAGDFLDGAYGKLVTEIGASGGDADFLPGMTMASEGYPGRRDRGVPEIYDTYARGDYLTLTNTKIGSQKPKFVARYTKAWQGIRVVNEFIENAIFIENGDEELINKLLGQAYFLRAFHYHLLTKRHGGLPYIKENLELDGELSQVRDSYANNNADILADIDIAINLLPVSWGPENIGRPTKGAAMALKSRVSLFGASPLVSNDPVKWEEAAKSASDLINFAQTNGLYTLADASAANSIDVGHNGADLFVPEPALLAPYRSIFVGAGITKVMPSEVIFAEVSEEFYNKNKIVLPTERMYLTVGFDALKGNAAPMGIGAIPSFVDKFETKTGLPISDPASGYNPQEPWINRDPRYYNAIIYDGVSWKVTTGAGNPSGIADLAILNEEGIKGLDLYPDGELASSVLWKVRNETGYRIRKWQPHGSFLTGGGRGEVTYHVNAIIFRMPEIYLNFAEAANEAYGPTGVVPGTSLTAVEAVNIVRRRVGMPDVAAKFTGSTNEFRERIKNERAVEFCFEGMRYDDLRRWKDLEKDEYKKVDFLEMRWQGGESATYPTGFSFVVKEQPLLEKQFESRNYWWPIPTSETEIIPVFLQTSGY